MSDKIVSESAKSGHKEIIGETIAKLKLFYEGFNVYSRFLDVDAVDFIIRHRKKDKIFYKEIQLKYSKFYKVSNDYWFGIQKHSFEMRNNHFFMFICGDQDKILIIPSKKLVSWLEGFHQGKNKWHVIIRERKNMWYFCGKKSHNPINITEFLNDFSSLRINN